MIKKLLVILTGVFCIIYILNPTAGVFELIPDNIPFIGNLDEASAVFLLLACFRYFNIDLTKIFNSRKKTKNKHNERI